MQKFNQLWRAGYTAHLDLDTYAGKAWVGLRVQLGDAQGPVHHHGHHQHQFAPASSHRSPSYWHRQEKRRQATVSSAKETSEKICENQELSYEKKSENEEASETIVAAEEATNMTKTDEVIEEVSDNIIAEKAKT